MANSSIKSVIGEVRFSYLHLFEPWKADDSDDAQYTATLLIPKSNTALLASIKKNIAAAYEAAVTEKWGGKKPAEGFWHNPLQDGDSLKQDGEERGEAYENCYFINTKTRQQPGVMVKDSKGHHVCIDSEEVYSGCYGYADIAFSGFTFGKKMGISCFLNNILKTRDGEPLGGSRNDAATAFADLLDSDDEM